MCINFISSLDFLSPFESIRFNKSSKFKSFYGGMLSLIVILFSLVMTFYISLDIFLKNEPTTSVNSIELLDDLRDYYFSKEEIQFFFALKFPNSTAYIDESIFTIRAIQIEIYNELTVKGLETTIYEKNINLRPCSEVFSQQEIIRYSFNFPVEKYYCIPHTQAKLKGYAGNKVSNSLKIYVEKCKNTTKNSSEKVENIANSEIKDKTCRPIEEINSYLTRGYINILTSNFFINEKDYDRPLIKYLSDISDIISDENTGLNYIIYYCKLKFINDDGLIFETPREENVAKIFNLKNSFDFQNNGIVAYIQFELANHMNTYKRGYPKIQDILTKVGGFINAINILGYLLYCFYFKAFRIIDLIIENHLDAFNISLKKTNLNAISEYIQNTNTKYFALESEKNIEIKKIENELANNKYETENNYNQNKNNNLVFLTGTPFKEKFKSNNILEGKLINIENLKNKLFEGTRQKTDPQYFSDDKRLTNEIRKGMIKEEISTNHISKKSRTDNIYKTKIGVPEKDRNLFKIENTNNCNSIDGLKWSNYDFHHSNFRNKKLDGKREVKDLNPDHDFLPERLVSQDLLLDEPYKGNSNLALKNADLVSHSDFFRFQEKNKKGFSQIPDKSHKISPENETILKQNANIKNILKLKCEIEEEQDENNNNIKIINNNILEFNINKDVNPTYSNHQLILNTEYRTQLYKNAHDVKKDNISKLNKSEEHNLNFRLEKDKEITNKNQNLEKSKEFERNMYRKSCRKTLRRTGNLNLTSNDFNFIMKKDLFLTYWCSNKNKKLNKILMNKEEIVNKYLSIENLTKVSFDVKFLKYLFLDKERIDVINRFYEYSILDDDKVKKLMHIILRENLDSSSYSNEELRNSELDYIEKPKKEKLKIVDDLLNFD